LTRFFILLTSSFATGLPIDRTALQFALNHAESKVLNTRLSAGCRENFPKGLDFHDDPLSEGQQLSSQFGVKSPRKHRSGDNAVIPAARSGFPFDARTTEFSFA
jgi:hypothetical protein